MATNRAGSQRIAVRGGERAVGESRPAVPQPRMTRQPVTHGSAWTTRRLIVFGAGGAAAAVAGALVFVSKFGVFGANDSPLLAIGFGLFVIGMVVFCACLIALIGTGIDALAQRSGWGAAIATALAPLALAWALWGAGAVGYAIPAVLSLVLIGGLVVALK